MKIKIHSENFDFDNLKYYLVNEFPKVRFWEVGENKLLAEKNKITGCYILAGKRNIHIISGFPSIQTNIIALILTVLGGFIVPIALYYIFLQKRHKTFENQIGETIAKKFSKYNLLNKTTE
jgi:hypothetical protein